VTGKEGYSATDETDASIPESASFASVPYGEIRISELIPGGYGEPLAFCADDAGIFHPVKVDGGAIVWDLRADAAAPLRCVFFNLQ
jgi:hypothetical protein